MPGPTTASSAARPPSLSSRWRWRASRQWVWRPGLRWGRLIGGHTLTRPPGVRVSPTFLTLTVICDGKTQKRRGGIESPGEYLAAGKGRAVEIRRGPPPVTRWGRLAAAPAPDTGGDAWA